MKIITTMTTVTNTLRVDDALVEGMSEADIAAKLESDPEFFGRDDDPLIEADQFVSIEEA